MQKQKKESNWNTANYPSEKGDCKKSQKNNLIITRNAFHAKNRNHISFLCFKA